MVYENMKTGVIYRTAPLICGFYLLCFASSCLTRLQHIGSELKSRNVVDTGDNIMIIPVPYNPIYLGGRRPVRHFSFYATRAVDIYFQLWRKTNGLLEYKLTAMSNIFMVPGAGIHNVTPSTPMYVQDGDVVGFFAPGKNAIPFDWIKCENDLSKSVYKRFPSSQEKLIGSIVVFKEKINSTCREYSLQVVVELPSSVSVGRCSSEPCTSMSWVKRASGKLIYSKHSQNVKADVTEVCAAMCVNQEWCQSFTFISLTYTCWMNPEVMDVTWWGYENENEAAYYIPTYIG